MREEPQSDAGPTLHLLGEMRLSSGNGDACPRGRKAQALLAYLAVAPDRSAARERLADLLWTDRAAEQARGSLRQALAEIRHAASDLPLLTADRQRVAMDGAALPTDIDGIRDAAGKRRGEELARRMARVRGPFLDRLDGLSAGYDEWLHVERPRQHERVLSAVLEAAPDMLAGGKPSDLQAIVASLEHLEPLNEAVARLGMRADHAGGDLASLHRRFRRLEEGLAREFGSPPSEETRALLARLTSFAASEPDLAPDTAPDLGPDPAPEASAAPPASAPPTVIVAPIEADGQGEAGELAAICTDDIRAALTRLAQIRVVALDTPDEARLERMCAGAVGAYLLSGRLRRIGGQVLVSLRLGQVGDGVILWSEQLRIEAADLFGAIDEVVERAAGAVMPSIDRDLASRLGAGQVTNGDAALLYTEARIRIRRARALDDAQGACALLERVIELDPNHVAARLLLARMYNTDFWQQMAGHDVRAFRARADRLGREAAALEPDNVDVLILRAWCHLRQREWRLAERGFEQATALLPFDADTIDHCAFGLCHLGELDRAEPLFQRAFRLNPFPPADYHADLAVMLALRGDAGRAEEHFEVSGERGLQYLAVRLANLKRAGAERRLHQLRNGFARAFREAWQQPRAPTTADVLAWIDDTLPLRRPEHRELVRGGLEKALGARW